jgi:predicted ATPase with chaperone activity
LCTSPHQLSPQPTAIESQRLQLPGFLIVGLLNAVVQESKEHMRTVAKNSGANFPIVRLRSQKLLKVLI